jgi:hypothetical protein
MWNWIKSWFVKAPVIADNIVPLVDEGEDIVTDIIKIIADLKSGNMVNVVLSANTLLKDVQEFVVVVKKVAADLKK